MKLIKKIILSMTVPLRRSKIIRDWTIKILINLHNFSYWGIGFFASYSGMHPKHRITKYHNFFLKNIDSNDSVLDVGCGNGSVAYDLSKKAKRVVGIDISKKNIELARKKFSGKNLQFILGDATKIKLPTNFDIIILSNVLEHIEERVNFLKKLGEISPKLLIRVPLITRDWISVFKKECGQEYRLSKDHHIEYEEEKFREEIETSGLKIKDYYVKFGELYAIILKND
jgi:2-polyprenyl-3-methyl-5-hydroxy-6-metoxy-1,4-benzoquinol methylase